MTKRLFLASMLLGLAATNANAEKIHVQVHGKKVNGEDSLINGVLVQYVTSQFYTVGKTGDQGVDGDIAVDFPALKAGKYRLKLTYNNTTITTTEEFSATPNGVNNYPIRLAKLVVKTRGNRRENVNGLAPSYVGVGGGFTNMPANVDGESSIQLLPVSNLRVNMRSVGTSSDQYVDLTAGTISELTFTLSKVTIPGAYFLAGTSGIGSLYALSNGQYVFPGTGPHTIKREDATTRLEVGNNDISMKALLLRLVNSKNAGISGAEAWTNIGGWQQLAYTSTNGYSLALIDDALSSVSSAMRFEGATEYRNETVIPANCIITYKTKKFDVSFKNSKGGGLVPGELWYNAGAWKQMANLTNGLNSFETLPVPFSVCLKHKGVKEYRDYAAGATSDVFKTVEVKTQITKCGGELLTPDELWFNGGEWIKMEITGKVATEELLPSSYTFYAKLNGSSQYLDPMPVNADKTVDFKATEVIVTTSNAAPEMWYNTDGYHFLGNDKEAHVNLLPGEWRFWGNGVEQSEVIDGCTDKVELGYAKRSTGRQVNMTESAFSVFPNPATNFINVKMPESGTVAIFSMEGKQVASYELSAGNSRVDVSTLATGTYVLVNGASTVRFVKQ